MDGQAHNHGAVKTSLSCHLQSKDATLSSFFALLCTTLACCKGDALTGQGVGLRRVCLNGGLPCRVCSGSIWAPNSLCHCG